MKINRNRIYERMDDLIFPSLANILNYICLCKGMLRERMCFMMNNCSSTARVVPQVLSASFT
jgi:hypothetical protein